ncbi:hypothetical protein J6590_066345 [Homalodisca vitripennis]|nr:hypothetical protein J6590_066345 [Homalodisca vitripennis]
MSRVGQQDTKIVISSRVLIQFYNNVGVNKCTISQSHRRHITIVISSRVHQHKQNQPHKHDRILLTDPPESRDNDRYIQQSPTWGTAQQAKSPTGHDDRLSSLALIQSYPNVGVNKCITGQSRRRDTTIVISSLALIQSYHQRGGYQVHNKPKSPTGHDDRYILSGTISLITSGGYKAQPSRRGHDRITDPVLSQRGGKQVHNKPESPTGHEDRYILTGTDPVLSPTWGVNKCIAGQSRRRDITIVIFSLELIQSFPHRGGYQAHNKPKSPTGHDDRYILSGTDPVLSPTWGLPSAQQARVADGTRRSFYSLWH